MAREVDTDTLRRIRIERLEGRHLSQTQPVGRERERASISDLDNTGNMAMESHTTLRGSRREREKEGVSEGHRRRHRDEEKRPRRSKRDGERERDGEEAQFVYGAPEKKEPNVRVSETRRLGRDGDSSEEETFTRSKTVREKPREKKVKVVYVTKEELKAEKQRPPRVKTVRDDKLRGDEDSVRRSREHHSRRTSVVEAPLPPSPPRRHTSTRILHSEARPSLKRSNTTTSHVPSTKSNMPSAAPTSPTAKRSSFIGSFFGPVLQQQHHEPEKLVECLTCLSDDIPRSKSAKLKCGHRMCHSCLKRIFRLSVNDPAHMPPKCCTADHIPLEHVDKLFNIDFKKNWNRKFQEFSTKNRIYCPARRCGEWIKPGNMHKDSNGRKYGKCGRCKTKVCCLCNGKWHSGKDCPKDEETNRLLAQAKQAGWQRCYNCRTMVELKEGCNHMTCRCNAEFCMICGLKWKSCNCPWFNYEAVEEDRLAHMRISGDRPNHNPMQLPQQPPHLVRIHRGLHVNADFMAMPNEPLDPPIRPPPGLERERQHRRDEAIARRLQRSTLNPDRHGRRDNENRRRGHDRGGGGDDGEGYEDYQGGIEDIHGVGNNAARYMNQDYVRAAQNILTGTFDQANVAANYVLGVANARGSGRNRDTGPPPPPAPTLLRRHTMRERDYNDTLPRERAAEKVVPRRSRVDYVAEAAVHDPLRREPPPESREERVGEREGRDRQSRGERAERGQRDSVLAGLGGRGNRVSAWRSFVRPGVEPEEGVISVVS
ncbi:related to ariadne-2 protein [Rhynchosporium secalis]|uniref:RBR-type E3 ubiquitin transferase n=1 Tax=Rhynchosporium secalis TaxID=38038 RepID=A0A1E1MV98_RHYSE|nr:related to ariadne-2 protein [Rhynchosporium secalis]